MHPIPTRGNEPGHFHYDVRFAVTVTGSEDYTVSEESHGLAWVEVERLSDYTTEESMLRMGRKWGEELSAISVQLLAKPSVIVIVLIYNKAFLQR
ncbi:MAG: hypothetical protein JXQ30_05570 [Spirochaetes bacterium]|nr:hypothetical protein [Spirochaetota bacterium]